MNHQAARYSLIRNRWGSWDAYAVCECEATVYGKGRTARSAQGAAADAMNAHVQRARVRVDA